MKEEQEEGRVREEEKEWKVKEKGREGGRSKTRPGW